MTKRIENKGMLKRVFGVLVVLLATSAVMVGAGSAADPWDGITNTTTWYNNEDATEFTITTAAELAGLAKLVNEGNTFAGKTIKLGADIDLNNQEWTPIGGAGTGKKFAGTFDGYKSDTETYKISNLTITKELAYTDANMQIGLFGAGTSTANIKNFTLENVNVKGSGNVAAVLGGTGGAEAKVTNVHVTGNVKVYGYWYVGSIMGKGYSTITDCSVKGDGIDTSYVRITGGYVGGIVGFMGEGNCVTTGCTVENITIEGAYNGIGGINGILHYGNTISDCEVKNVVVWATSEPDTDSDEGRIYCGAFAGTYLDNGGKSGPTLSNCEFTGKLYSGAAKNDILEETRYVGSLWYGAEPPATVTITNCKINVPQYTITWDTGTTTTTTTVTHGSIPVYSGETPTKAEDDAHTYTFSDWTPKPTKATEDTTYTAQFTATLKTYTITWKWNDGEKDVTVTKEAGYGTVPVYEGDAPTKAETETQKFTFNGWKKENVDEGITTVTGATTYIAKFIETEKTPEGGSGETEETKTETVQPIVPVAPVETTVGETTVTTIVTNTGSNDIKVADNKLSAQIDAKDANEEKVATITISFENAVSENAGGTNSVTGEIKEVTISYDAKSAESASIGNTNEVTYQMDLTVKTVVTDLPKIESTIQPTVVDSVKKENSNLKPVAMITATNTDAINTALQEEGSKITLVFTVPKTAIKDENKIRILHVKGDNVEEATILNVADKGTDWEITAEGTSFSSYVVVEDTYVAKPSSSSSSSGSSVWLQEPATPTPTPTPTETATPTDTVPTDIPVTQPTATPASPGFGILAALAGLGAVAVLRRK